MPNEHFDNILYDTVGSFASALQGRSHPHSLPGYATMATWICEQDCRPTLLPVCLARRQLRLMDSDVTFDSG
jgi:hypothetical protein